MEYIKLSKAPYRTFKLSGTFTSNNKYTFTAEEKETLDSFINDTENLHGFYSGYVSCFFRTENVKYNLLSYDGCVFYFPEGDNYYLKVSSTTSEASLNIHRFSTNYTGSEFSIYIEFYKED